MLVAGKDGTGCLASRLGRVALELELELELQLELGSELEMELELELGSALELELELEVELEPPLVQELVLELELGLVLELNKGPGPGLHKVVYQANMVCWAGLANMGQAGWSVLAMQGTQMKGPSKRCLSVGHN